jgi:hypothetical protein
MHPKMQLLYAALERLKGSDGLPLPVNLGGDTVTKRPTNRSAYSRYPQRKTAPKLGTAYGSVQITASGKKPWCPKSPCLIAIGAIGSSY